MKLHYATITTAKLYHCTKCRWSGTIDSAGPERDCPQCGCPSALLQGVRTRKRSRP